MKADQVLRDQLLALLKGENAHLPFDRAVSGFPADGLKSWKSRSPGTGFRD